MKDGNTSPKVLDDLDNAVCASCRRVIFAGELYGAHGLCSQCLEDDHGEHHGG